MHTLANTHAFSPFVWAVPLENGEIRHDMDGCVSQYAGYGFYYQDLGTKEDMIPEHTLDYILPISGNLLGKCTDTVPPASQLLLLSPV